MSRFSNSTCNCNISIALHFFSSITNVFVVRLIINKIIVIRRISNKKLMYAVLVYIFYLYIPKPQRKQIAGHPCVESFLIKLKMIFFCFFLEKPWIYNLIKAEWQGTHNLEGRSVIIKSIDKVCVLSFENEKIVCLMVINTLMITQHKLTAQILMKLRKVTKSLRDCAIRNLLRGKNWNVFHIVLRMLVVQAKCISHLKSKKDYLTF